MPSNTAPRKAQSKANKPAARDEAVGFAVPVKHRTDWDAVERDYRTGKFTLRELEEKHGVFNSSIARKAKEGRLDARPENRHQASDKRKAGR